MSERSQPEGGDAHELGPGGRAGAGGPAAEDPLRRSRTSRLWFALVASGVLLILLIVFITQNTQDVRVTFFGLEADAPLSVALLIAAVGGLLLAASAGSLRIWQLRRRVRRLEQ